LAVLVLHRHLDRDGPRAPAAGEDRARPRAPTVRGDGVGRRLPVRAVTRGVAYALGVAAAGALATAIGHGAHNGHVVAAILAPLGVATVVLAHWIVRARGLRRQFVAIAVLVVAQLAALIALMAAAMFVEGSDAFFTVVAAGYAAAIGLWAGRLLERGAVDQLVSETVEAMRRHAEAGAVQVATELPAGGAWARTNPEQLQRVLFNLLQNAIRHTPPDGSVVVRAEPHDGALEIEVAD